MISFEDEQRVLQIRRLAYGRKRFQRMQREAVADTRHGAARVKDQRVGLGNRVRDFANRPIADGDEQQLGVTRKCLDVRPLRLQQFGDAAVRFLAQPDACDRPADAQPR